MALINCGETYYQQLSGCNDTITFELGLTPTTDYSIEFVFANSFKLRKDITTNAQGKFTLNRNTDLAGFWNDSTGPILFTVYEDASYNVVTLTICTKEYQSLTLDFTTIDGDTINIVPAPCN